MPVSRTARNLKDYLPEDEEGDYESDPEDDEEEEERPQRRRPRRDEDEEEERPARRRRTRDEDEEEEERPKRKTRRPVEDDEEEEDPDEVPDRSSIIQAGWEAAKRRMDASSDYANEFKMSEEDQVVKFLAAKPFSYSQHWLDKREKGEKKSFVCIGDTCPLCRILGDKPQDKFAWPIVNLSERDMPAQLLIGGVKLAKQLEKQNLRKGRGLENNYWVISRTGTKNVSYTTDMIRDDELEDPFEIDVEEAEVAIEKAAKKPPTIDSIYISPRSELLKIARELD